MEVAGVLVICFNRGVMFGFQSRLGCSEQNTITWRTLVSPQPIVILVIISCASFVAQSVERLM